MDVSMVLGSVSISGDVTLLAVVIVDMDVLDSC
jgi:hypothetical protein